MEENEKGLKGRVVRESNNLNNQDSKIKLNIVSLIMLLVCLVCLIALLFSNFKLLNIVKDNEKMINLTISMSTQAPGFRHGDSAPFCFARETKSL